MKSNSASSNDSNYDSNHFNNAMKKLEIDVVLVSLGTPDALTTSSIRGFLRRFLSDKRVVEAPRLVWLPVLYFILLPFRPKKLKHAYQQIWEKNGGSPLRIIAQQQAAALQESIDQDEVCSDQNINIHTVMLYDVENVENFLKKRAQVQRKTILIPLYPQYSATTTAAVYDQLFSAYSSLRNIPQHIVIKQYYEHPFYRDALTSSVQSFWKEHSKPDHLLMSFHGIPKEYVEKGDPYQQQCIETALNLAADLGLSETESSCSFQSRLGPKEWLQPYTDETLEHLGRQGVKILDVICPSFSADCLETLEEIAIQGNETFVAAGGEKLRLIPCLNVQEKHIELFKRLVVESI